MQSFLNQEENVATWWRKSTSRSSAEGIDDMAQHFLAKKGIVAVRRVKKSDMRNWPAPPRSCGHLFG